MDMSGEIRAVFADFWKAIANPCRIKILYALLERPLSVAELAKSLNAPRTKISTQLRALRSVHLIAAKREGRFLRYRLADQRIIEALELLKEIFLEQLKDSSALIHSSAFSEARDSKAQATDEKGYLPE